jgi:two-component system cell cycle response regulator
MHKILVIDDQPNSILLLQERLRRAGYAVFAASSGKEGLEQAVKVRPDAILLDVMMPDIDGYEVCRKLQVNPETAIIPILFVSARIQPEDVREGFRAGAADYIKKPVEFIELFERIASIIRQRELIAKKLVDEKMQTFSATIVSANHHLKQPLTLINLATTAVRRLLTKNPIVPDEVNAKLDIINSSVSEISDILNKYIASDDPRLDKYVGDIKMFDVSNKEQS